MQMVVEIRAIGPQEWVIIALLLVGLFLLSVRFNGFIDKQLDTDKLGGYNGWFVVVGVSYTAIVALVILGFLLGWWTALISVAVMFVTFVVAIIPMIQGDMARSSRERQRLLEDLRKRQLEQQLSKGIDDGYTS